MFPAAAGGRVPTNGRALDRVGFFGPGLASFCEHVQGRPDADINGSCEGPPGESHGNRTLHVPPTSVLQ